MVYTHMVSIAKGLKLVSGLDFRWLA